MIASVDEFVLYDDVQYTRRDWRNRNKIKTPSGVQWLTVPVEVKGKYRQTIRDAVLSDKRWAKSHWRVLFLNYKKANFFNEIADWLEPIYLQKNFEALSDLNRYLIEEICGYLGIKTVISSSSDYFLLNDRNERLASICEQAGATCYISGPAAKVYLSMDPFKQRKVRVNWFNYAEYPQYDQLWEGFEHRVSILDLLFNCGANSRKYLRQVNE